MFFFNDTATTEIYTLSLHDALPISDAAFRETARNDDVIPPEVHLAERYNHIGDISWDAREGGRVLDRKSTRLNSSHANISYAVFCLKKKILPITGSDTIITLDRNSK